MDYKEALFGIVDEIVKRAEDKNWDGFTETVFGILEEVDDKKAVVEFLAKLTDDDTITNLGEPFVWVIDCLAKVAKKAVGI